MIRDLIMLIAVIFVAIFKFLGLAILRVWDAISNLPKYLMCALLHSWTDMEHDNCKICGNSSFAKTVTTVILVVGAILALCIHAFGLIPTGIGVLILFVVVAMIVGGC